MAKTRKAKSKGKVLKVDSADKIAEMESLLGKGSITFVLIYADWCGACTKFKKNIWNPMCQKSAAHSRVAVRDDMVGKTSLASANFEYLPSLVVIDENGKMQSFKTPEGKDTHAMPTPQSLQEMNTIVNVPVGPVGPVGPSNANKQIEEDPEIPMSNVTPLTLNPALTLHANEPLTLTPSSEPKGSLGKSYVPTPLPMKPMSGGRRVSFKDVTAISAISAIPKKVLKGLAGLFKKSRKASRKAKRSRKAKPSRKLKRSRKVKHSR
jgi:hypothetical protein